MAWVQQAGGHLVTVFVITSMLGIGLTQKPSRIIGHLRNYQFLTTMLLLNLVVVPALMVYAVRLVPVATHYEIGLILFGLAAGAPFLIHLTKTSQRDLALGATVLMVLMLGTVITMPVIAPLLIEGVAVTAWDIVQPMLGLIVLPLVIGMVLLQFFESFAARIHRIVARAANLALYAAIVAILVGSAQAFLDPELWIALGLGLAVIVLAFLIGYMTGDGHDHLKDLGGLGTAQRGTASAMIVASTAFDEPRILVVITLLNTIALLLLIPAAKWLSPDNRFSFLTPVAADTPERRAEAPAGSSTRKDD